MPWHHAVVAAGPCLAVSTACYKEEVSGPLADLSPQVPVLRNWGETPAAGLLVVVVEDSLSRIAQALCTL
jgi:hypothetical protein